MMKLRTTDVAGLNVLLPDCEARSVHSPSASSKTTLSGLTLQIVGASDVMLTGSPDEAAADARNAASFSFLLGNSAKVIV
jgi:hypothetical protein